MNTYNGRKIIQEKEFKEQGTFKSMYAAMRWLKENGYEYGSTCKDRTYGGNMPVAIQKGEYDLPQKWINFDIEDKKSVDGVIVSNDFREGSVIVLIFEPNNVNNE